MTGASTARLPLAGIRVIDVATVIAAPYCAAILGEFGAEVLKVEHPMAAMPVGASARRPAAAITLTWLSEARNKKSVTIDLRSHGRGRAVQAAGRRDRHRLRELPAGHAGEVGAWAGRCFGRSTPG